MYPPRILGRVCALVDCDILAAIRHHARLWIPFLPLPAAAAAALGASAIIVVHAASEKVLDAALLRRHLPRRRVGRGLFSSSSPAPTTAVAGRAICRPLRLVIRETCAEEG